MVGWSDIMNGMKYAVLSCYGGVGAAWVLVGECKEGLMC